MTMIDETEHRDILKGIRGNLIELIGNDLGKYELLNSSGVKISKIPAIWTEPPTLPNNYRVKKDSGIECVIGREVEIEADPLMGSYFYRSYYPITMRQHNLDKSLSPPLQRILAYPYHHVLDFLITPYRETSDGIIKPRATLKLCVARLVG